MLALPGGANAAPLNPMDYMSLGTFPDGDITLDTADPGGEIVVEARLDYGMKPGTVAVTNGWWITDGGAVNFCSLGRETDMGHGAAFHDNLVEVETVSPPLNPPRGTVP